MAHAPPPLAEAYDFRANPTPAPDPPRRWSVVVPVLGVGLVAMQAVGNLSVAMMALSLAFGGSGMRNAAYLLRTDPVQARGRLQALGALAGSACELFFFTLVYIILLVPLMLATGVRGGPDAPITSFTIVLGASGLMMAGAMLAALTLGMLCFLVAWWTGRRVWIGPPVGEARRRRLWPPWMAGSAANNKPTRWFFLLVVITGTVGLVAVETVLILGLGKAAEGFVTAIYLVVMLGTLIGVPVAALLTVGRRAVAATPFDAWELADP